MPKVNILLVDDKPENLLALEATLRDLGQNLVMVRSGTEALKKLLEDAFAVIVLDVQMPEMDGFETASLIRSRERSQHTPILFVTAINKSAQHVARGYEVGAADYLVKPFDPAILKAKVAAFVEMAEQAQELQIEIERRQKAEEAVRKLNQGLERRVAERTLALEAANTLLQTEIEERRRAEQQSRDSEARFRALVEYSADAIALMSPDGILRYAGPSTRRLLGFAPEEWVGKNPFALLHPEDVPHITAAFARVAQNPGAIETAECRMRHKDGAWRWVEAVGANLLAEPSVQSIVINYRDITERKQREAEIRALNQRLRRAMTETHHRVKNSLQVLAAMVDMRLMNETAPPTFDDLRQLALHIKALAAVHHLLTQESRTDDQAHFLSADKALTMLLPLIQQTAPDRPLQFTAEPVRVTTRQGSSLALLTNELVMNALKHGQGVVEVALAVQARQVRLEVRDDGPGFPAGFDPRTHAHTGLELAQVLVATDLEGRIACANGTEGGARVVVTFPLADDAPTNAF